LRPAHDLTSGAKLLNVKAIRANLMREAKAALEMSLEQTLKDAKEKAPVRDIFTGGSHGRSGLVSVGNNPRSRARRGSEMLVAERGIKVIRRKPEDQAAFMEAVKQQSWARHRYELLETNKFGSPTGRTQRLISHPRAFDPVLIDVAGTPRRAFGGFRDVTGLGFGEGGRSNLPFRTMAGPPELLEPASGSRSREEAAPLQTVEEYLGVRGRAELARQSRIFQRAESGIAGTGLPAGRYSSRANSALYSSSTGDTTIGGRLRDEIYRTGVRDTGKTISGWVVSPTPYAKYQEYGTSRHRPQPYMRPALYKAREHLPRLVKAHLGRKFR
jgi:HK97 gp10 family phage protein